MRRGGWEVDGEERRGEGRGDEERKGRMERRWEGKLDVKIVVLE